VYKLPPIVQEKRDKLAKVKGKPLKVCVFGFSSLAKEIIESLREDVHLKVYLVTKSIIETQRADIDGKVARELLDVIGKIDFWILLTPYDDVLDFRNETEENLEHIPSRTSIFSKDELQLLKDECVIANMCNFPISVELVKHMETLHECRLAMFPN
jgi:phosphoglycerate dehydrogenase-like enzyme